MASKSLEDFGYDQAVITVTERLGGDAAAALGVILERSHARFEKSVREEMRWVVAVTLGAMTVLTGVFAAIVSLAR